MTITQLQPTRQLASPPLPHHLPPPTLFRSFWMGGYESACQINTFRRRIDMLAATQHDVLAGLDYALLRSINMAVARDGMRWHLMEPRPGHYDFSSFAPMLHAALQHRIQVIWNVCHYGWPDDLDLFSPAFVDRFARFSRAVLRFIRDHTDEPQFFTPVNEISFLAWAIGLKGWVYPYTVGRGWDVKAQCVRAAIAGMEAMWDLDPRTRFCHIDPIIHVVPPRDRPDLLDHARAQHEGQFESWDLLAGRRAPELGGAEKYLDIMGVNYYHSNQFESPDVRLRWEDHPRDERFVPFHELLHNVYLRYRKPIFIAETSHFGAGRALWMHEIAEEICTARLCGIPLEGACIYPIIDRPDWENPDHWHNSGLFDLVPNDLRLERVIHPEYATALRHAQRFLAEHHCR